MILVGDCVEKIRELSDESVHCIITTPPMGDDWSYHAYLKTIKWTYKEGIYGDYDFPILAKEMYRVLKPGGMLCWHVGDVEILGSESLVHARQALYLVDECGFNLHATIIFVKHSFISLQERYPDSYEYIMCFSKGTPCVFNKIHATKVWEGTTSIQEDMIESIKINGLENVSLTRNGHPSKTPNWLVKDLILTYTVEGDVILDPFSGSGTTIKEAEKLNRKGIGIEINEKYVT